MCFVLYGSCFEMSSEKKAIHSKQTNKQHVKIFDSYQVMVYI